MTLTLKILTALALLQANAWLLLELAGKMVGIQMLIGLLTPT